MRRWHGTKIPCPDCEELLTPEFYNGWWRIPDHNYGDSNEPCGAYGEKVIAK